MAAAGRVGVRKPRKRCSRAGPKHTGVIRATGHRAPRGGHNDRDELDQMPSNARVRNAAALRPLSLCTVSFVQLSALPRAIAEACSIFLFVSARRRPSGRLAPRRWAARAFGLNRACARDSVSTYVSYVMPTDFYFLGQQSIRTRWRRFSSSLKPEAHEQEGDWVEKNGKYHDKKHCWEFCRAQCKCKRSSCQKTR